MTKAYYFPPARAMVTGIVLLLIGLSPLYGAMLIEHSVTTGLQFFLELFTGFPEFIPGIMSLVFISSGVLYIKNARTILRLKLDDKGVYYLPFAEGNPSRYKALFNLFFLKEALKLIPYNNIASAEYVVDKWWGEFVLLRLKNGEARRLLTAPFTVADKKEMVCSLIAKPIMEPRHNFMDRLCFFFFSAYPSVRTWIPIFISVHAYKYS